MLAVAVLILLCLACAVWAVSLVLRALRRWWRGRRFLGAAERIGPCSSWRWLAVCFVAAVGLTWWAGHEAIGLMEGFGMLAGIEPSQRIEPWATDERPDLDNVLWLIGVILIGAAPICGWLIVLSWKRKWSGLCLSCGYSLAGLRAGICPECGAVPDDGKGLVNRRRFACAVAGALVVVGIACEVLWLGLPRRGMMRFVPTTVVIPLRHVLTEEFIPRLKNARWQQIRRVRWMWGWQRVWAADAAAEDLREAETVADAAGAAWWLEELNLSVSGIPPEARHAERTRLLRMGFDRYMNGTTQEQEDAMFLIRRLTYPMDDFSPWFDDGVETARRMIRSGISGHVHAGAQFLRRCARDPRALATLEELLNDQNLAVQPPVALGVNPDHFRRIVLREVLKWPGERDLLRLTGFEDGPSGLGETEEARAIRDRLFETQYVRGNSLMRESYVIEASSTWRGAPWRLWLLVPKMTDSELKVLSKNGWIWERWQLRASEAEFEEVSRFRKEAESAVGGEYIRRFGGKAAIEELNSFDWGFLGEEKFETERELFLDAAWDAFVSGTGPRFSAANALIPVVPFIEGDLTPWIRNVKQLWKQAGYSLDSYSGPRKLLTELRIHQAIRFGFLQPAGMGQGETAEEYP